MQPQPGCGARARGRQACRRARLVLGTDAVDVQYFGELVQAAVQVVAEFHQILDVVHGREVDLRSRALQCLAVTYVSGPTRE